VVDGAKTYYIWIIDYKLYEVKSIGVSLLNPNECDELSLTLTADKFDMKYIGASSPRGYSINYEVPIEYNSMIADETKKDFNPDPKSFPKAVTPTITLLRVNKSGEDELPYQNTTFKVGNDRFATQWGLVKSIVSEDYTAVAVKAKAEAKHTVRDAENELEKEKAPLGGSAPVEITFTGYANEPTTTYYTWDFASNNKFTNSTIIASITDKNARYTFSQAGKFYARLTVANSKNSCIDSTQVFEIEVTESQLKVPNAFSPNGDDKNDIFLVAYKSIVKFNGWIFNRYGNQVFTWSDPSKGWDGKIGGKYVIPGVYFYVIEAEGSEGKQWKLKGDINVFSER
jgi:gliding motility-associated-like protein